MNIRERIRAALADAKPPAEKPIERFEAFTPEAKAAYPVSPTRLVVRDLINVDAETTAVCAVVGEWLRVAQGSAAWDTTGNVAATLRDLADEIDPPAGQARGKR